MSEVTLLVLDHKSCPKFQMCKPCYKLCPRWVYVTCSEELWIDVPLAALIIAGMVLAALTLAPGGQAASASD